MMLDVGPGKATRATDVVECLGMAEVTRQVRQDADQERGVWSPKHEGALALVTFFKQQMEGHITRETGSRSQVDYMMAARRADGGMLGITEVRIF
jgi:hypothetical protein